MEPDLYWSSSYVAPKCECGEQTLPMLTDASLKCQNDGELWCPSCNARYVLAYTKTDGRGRGVSASTVPAAVRVIRLPDNAQWVARVERNGEITLSVTGVAVMTTQELRRYLELMTWLGRGAQGRQEVVAGVDRWTFTPAIPGGNPSLDNVAIAHDVVFALHAHLASSLGVVH